MHQSAYKNAKTFYDTYGKNLKPTDTVVDIGSYDVNGSLKPLFVWHRYIGVDISPGPNVDKIMKNHRVDIADNTAAMVVSSSCFEHDSAFWLTFSEMVRICKPGGYIYVQAPRNGPYHGYPRDCWRFYEDSWKALEEWINMHHRNHTVQLVESYVDRSNKPSILRQAYNWVNKWWCKATRQPVIFQAWEDSIGIFIKIS